MSLELAVVLTACPPHAAEQLAELLVAQRLAACVTALPGGQSTYRWQGAIQREPETLLLIKVPRPAVAACVAALEAAHPYEVPEVVVLSAAEVSAAYLAWAFAACDLPSTRAP